MKTKKDRNYSFAHCQQRASERYSVEDLPREVWEFWASHCKSGHYPVLYTNKNGDIIQTTHIAHWSDKKFIVVYENKRDCITTLLPPNKEYHFCGKLRIEK
jgi:hypothetical protein